MCCFPLVFASVELLNVKAIRGSTCKIVAKVTDWLKGHMIQISCCNHLVFFSVFVCIYMHPYRKMHLISSTNVITPTVGMLMRLNYHTINTLIERCMEREEIVNSVYVFICINAIL